MFDRILTGPIVPEEVSRRGRRPKNALAKAAASANTGTNAAALGLNPLLANGLLTGLDLNSLQTLQSIQSLQLTAGLIGLQPDAANMAAMLPMMLSGMAGLPNLLGMGSLLGKQDTGAIATGSEEAARKKSGESTAQASSVDIKVERTESQSSPASSSTITNSTQLNASASGHPLALNPLLLSSMLYPGMLLNPGLNMPVANQPQATNAQPAPSAQPVPSEAAKQHPGRSEVKAEDIGEEPEEQKDNSGPEGSGKAESSSSASESSSSSSEESDSSDEDWAFIHI